MTCKHDISTYIHVKPTRPTLSLCEQVDDVADWLEVLCSRAPGLIQRAWPRLELSNKMEVTGAARLKVSPASALFPFRNDALYRLIVPQFKCSAVLPKHLGVLECARFCHTWAITSNRVIRRSMSLLSLDAPPSSALWSIDSGRVGFPLRMRGIAVLPGDHTRVLFTNIFFLSVYFILSWWSCNILNFFLSFILNFCHASRYIEWFEERDMKRSFTILV